MSLKNQESKTGYTTISMPNDMIQEVQDIINTYPGYRNRTEFIVEAVRLRVNALKLNAHLMTLTDAAQLIEHLQQGQTRQLQKQKK